MTVPERMNAAQQIAMVDPDDFEDALGYLLGFATRNARLPNASLDVVSGPLSSHGAYLVRETHSAYAWVVLYWGDDLMQAILAMARHRLEHDPDFWLERTPAGLAAYAAGLAHYVAEQEATVGRPSVQRLIVAAKGCADLIRNGGTNARDAYEDGGYDADEVYGDGNLAASLVRFAGDMAEHAMFMLEYGHVSTIEVYRQAIGEVLQEAATCSSTPIQRVHATWRGEQIRKSLGTMLANGMPARSTVSEQDWYQAVTDLQDLFYNEVKTLFFDRFGPEEIDIVLSPSDPRLDVAGFDSLDPLPLDEQEIDRLLAVSN